MTTTIALELGRALAARLTQGLMFDDLLGPEATVWHSYDELSHPAQRLLEQAAFQKQNLAPDLHSEEVRLNAHASGFVIEQVVVGTLPDGTVFRIPGAVVAQVANGKIQAIREYVTESAAAAVMAAAASLGQDPTSPSPAAGRAG